MANFFKDYWALCGESIAFLKIHWLGTIIFSLGCGAVAGLVEYTILEPKWPVWLLEKVKTVFSRG